jgi:hypothetical protein
MVVLIQMNSTNGQVVQVLQVGSVVLQVTNHHPTVAVAMEEVLV